MKNSIENKVLAFCREQDMFAPGDKVIVGVSGGADSVCLLAVLHALSSELTISLMVAHVNHGIRGEAGEDAAYVKTLCDKLGVPFFEKVIDIPSLAKERKLSEELVGRDERYAFFESLATEQGAGKIAVAHHKNDRAETVLFHLMRGSGVAGLSGIRAKREAIVRPLLCLDRSDVEEYLSVAGLSYCHDATNDEDDYTRNRIRHHILEYATKEISEGAVDNICMAAAHMERTQEYILSQTKAATERCRVEEDSSFHRKVFSIERILMEHELIRESLVFEALKELSENGKDIYRTHVDAVMGLIRTEGNRFVRLSNSIVASRSYDELTLEKFREAKSEPTTPIMVEVPMDELRRGEITLRVGAETIVLRIFDFDGCMDSVPQNGCTKWLDCDKIDDKLFIRTRQIGDYFMVKSGDTICHKKLKSYLIDEKVPAKDRDKLLLLAQGSHVLCLLPGRMSEAYKVTESTKKILHISIKGSC